MFSSITPSPTPPSISMPSVGPTIQMTFTPAEYEAWKQSQASTSSANLASTSGKHAFLASRSSWVIDSGALAHMSGTPSTLSSLTPTTVYPLVSIAHGRSCSIKGYESTKPTPSLTLHNVSYLPGFPTNLLSISTITHTLNCVAIFYPFYCVFLDLRTGQRIGLGHENGRGGVRPPSPPRYDTTAPEEPFCVRGSIRLSLFLYYEILTRTCLSGSSFISLSLLGFQVGSSLFGILFVKPFLFVNLYFI